MLKKITRLQLERSKRVMRSSQLEDLFRQCSPTGKSHCQNPLK